MRKIMTVTLVHDDDMMMLLLLSPKIHNVSVVVSPSPNNVDDGMEQQKYATILSTIKLLLYFLFETTHQLCANNKLYLSIEAKMRMKRARRLCLSIVFLNIFVDSKISSTSISSLLKEGLMSGLKLLHQ
jgi:hypothetical protein